MDRGRSLFRPVGISHHAHSVRREGKRPLLPKFLRPASVAHFPAVLRRLARLSSHHSLAAPWEYGRPVDEARRSVVLDVSLQREDCTTRMAGFRGYRTLLVSRRRRAVLLDMASDRSRAQPATSASLLPGLHHWSSGGADRTECRWESNCCVRAHA